MKALLPAVPHHLRDTESATNFFALPPHKFQAFFKCCKPQTSLFERDLALASPRWILGIQYRYQNDPDIVLYADW